MSRTLVKYVAVLSLALAVGAVPLQASHAQEPPGEEGVAEDSAEVNPSYRISASPWLQLPVNRKDYPPITAPLRHATGDEKGLSTVVVHDMATGTTAELPHTAGGPRPMGSGVSTTPPYTGLLPSGLGLESVFPPDDRSRITPTTGFPWRTIVALFMSFPGGSGGCSGAMVDGYHLLTAGHCVYSHTAGGWATSIRVVPALDGTYMPYNEAWATYLRSYTGWTSYGYTEDDWALVTLDRNVGNFTGWMGRATAGSGDSMYTGILNTAGYPCNVYSASCPYPKSPDNSMWSDSDNGRTATEYNHWYWMDTMPGQSGSPVWVYYSSTGNRYIVTVHTSGDDGSGSNHGTRLNQDKYDRISTWIGADTPPTDRADLVDDGDAWSGFSPTAVKPGTTAFHAWSDVRNIGTAASGGFNVSYYASLNTTISTSDYPIGTDSVPSINAFYWADSDWSGTFPAGVPDGLYWVGWIIDSGGWVSEFNEGNNTAYEGGYRLLVDGTAPSNPSVSSSSHTVGVWSSDNTVDVNWSGASDGSGSGVYGYSFEWSTSAGTLPDAVADTTGNSTTSSALADSDNWYFHIRTRDNVGNWNAAAVHLGPFRIDRTGPSNPTSAAETHGAPNNTWQNTVADPAFTWSGASDGSGSGVAGYHVYWGTNSAGTSATWTVSASYDPGAVPNPSIYYLRVQTEDAVGNTASWQTLFTFRYDAAAPSNPSVSSSSHTVGVWSSDNTVDVNWSGASDGSGSGVYGYSFEWSTSASTLPDAVADTTGNSATSSALADSGNWYFHIRTRDNAGNWNAAAVHLGPFWIDSTGPSNPSIVSSSSHTVGAWSSDNTIDMNWSGASDGSGSGVYGYSFEWSTSAGTLPDAVADTTGNSTTSPALADGDNWYFHVRTRDNVGNWNGAAVHAGPFRLDTAAPSCQVNALPSSQTAIAFPVTWSGSDPNPASGLRSYDIQYRVGSGGVWVDWLLDTLLVSRSFGPADPIRLANGQTYYFRCRSRDNVGNLGTYQDGSGDTWTTIVLHSLFLPVVQKR